MSGVAMPPYRLPLSILSRADVKRCLRELEAVESFMGESAVRAPGTKSGALPPSSKMLTDFCQLNGLNLLRSEDQQAMRQTFEYLRQYAPVLHFSFAVEASPLFVQKLANWVRDQIDPLALMQTGLSPSVVVGCAVRSTNKVFDMSLHQAFKKSEPILAKAIKDLGV